MADVLNRIRGPFNVSAPAIAAGTAAIADQSFVETSVEHNDLWLDWLSKELQILGLGVTPSVGNFLLLHFPSDPARNAAAADSHLQDNGFVLRRMESYGLPQTLRLTIGTEEANRKFIDIIRSFLA